MYFSGSRNAFVPQTDQQQHKVGWRAAGQLLNLPLSLCRGERRQWVACTQ